MNKPILLILILTLVVPITGSYAQDNAVPRYEPVDECFIEMPDDVDYDCGYVTVPEFHGVDNGRTVEIGVIRLNSLSGTSSEPVFVGAGGPGGSVLQFAATFSEFSSQGIENFFTDMWAERDLIFFGHRGTVHTDPHLTCDAASDAFVDALLNEEDPHLAQFEAIKTCYEDYVAEGIELSAFNSEQIAADANAIRELWNYDQIIYYGESYGTLLGQHIMRQYPETLSAVILDGAVPISAPTWVTNTDAKYRRAIDYVVEVCATDPACNEAYPDFGEDIEAVYNQLSEEPIQLQIGDQTLPLTSDLYAIAVFDNMYATGFIGFMPAAVNNLVNGEVDQAVFAFISNAFPRSSVARLMHYATVCSEDPVNSLDEALSLDDEQAGIIESYIEDDAGGYIELCGYMDLPVFPDETDDAPIESDIPVLILSGGFDPITPEVFALSIQDTLTTSYAYTMPYGAHVQLLTGNPCASEIASQFIADPFTEPDANCIADAEPLEFLLPDDITELFGE